MKSASLKIAALRALVKTDALLRPRRYPCAGRPRRFLVVSTTGIGDTLWGTPALQALKESHPDSMISVLTNTTGREILRGNPAVDEFFVFRRGAAGLLSLPSLAARLRAKRFDTVFIFHASERLVWLLSSLAGAGEIIGIEGQNKGLDFILTTALSQDVATHGVETRFSMIRCAGAAPSPRNLSLYLSHEDRQEAADFLARHGIGEETALIGLQPGAQKPFKCWPAGHFIVVGKTLREKLNCRVVVTGGPEERELAEEVASGIEGAVSAVGALSLRGTAALIGKMDVFITNDTGPMHMAFALGTPTVALFCPTEPALCGPYCAGQRVSVIQKPASCKPCIGKKCYNPRCMEQITPREVVSSAVALLHADRSNNAHSAELPPQKRKN